MSATAGTSDPRRRELAARRLAANLTAALLAVLGAMLIDRSESWDPMPTAVSRQVGSALNRLCTATAAMTLKIVGQAAVYEDNTIHLVSATYTFAGSVGPAAEVPTVTRMLLFGAVVAGAVWGLGWGRRLMLVAIALLLPAGLLPFINGIVLGAFLAVHGDKPLLLARSAFPGTAAAAVLTTLAVAGLWWITKAIVAEGDDVRPLPDDQRAAGPLLWAALAQTPLVMIVIAPPLGFLVKSEVVTLLCKTVAAVAYGSLWGGLFLAAILRRSRAVRWFWLPLLPLAALGPARSLAWAVMLVVVAVNDERTAGLCGTPLEAAARARVGRRGLRPLTPVAWLCVLGSAAGALGRLAAVAGLLTKWRLASWLESPWTVGAMAVLGGALAAWEFASLRRGGQKGLAGPARLAAIAAAAAAVIGVPIVALAG